MKRTCLAEAVKKAASASKKIPCRSLFRISKARGAALSELGKLCDRQGIKITRCQLGCFG
jgi:hypothetical protein